MDDYTLKRSPFFPSQRNNESSVEKGRGKNSENRG